VNVTTDRIKFFMIYSWFSNLSKSTKTLNRIALLNE